uniref:DNA-directed RNA polymerase subunit H n=1 Tax=Archaeoglobus fulgidus TaxID=2234 RepID=A0A7C3ZEN4_ARCFL
MLVPKHEVLSKEEAEELFKKYLELEKSSFQIKAEDPIVKEIGAKPGDIIRIIRKSLTAGESVFYRLVV